LTLFTDWVTGRNSKRVWRICRKSGGNRGTAQLRFKKKKNIEKRTPAPRNPCDSKANKKTKLTAHWGGKKFWGVWGTGRGGEKIIERGEVKKDKMPGGLLKKVPRKIPKGGLPTKKNGEALQKKSKRDLAPAKLCLTNCKGGFSGLERKGGFVAGEEKKRRESERPGGGQRRTCFGGFPRSNNMAVRLGKAAARKMGVRIGRDQNFLGFGNMEKH